ncbi:Uncharacterized protein PBTT_00566 [Plasmodiophora brassicae]
MEGIAGQLAPIDTKVAPGTAGEGDDVHEGGSAGAESSLTTPKSTAKECPSPPPTCNSAIPGAPHLNRRRSRRSIESTQKRLSIDDLDLSSE